MKRATPKEKQYLDNNAALFLAWLANGIILRIRKETIAEKPVSFELLAFVISRAITIVQLVIVMQEAGVSLKGTRYKQKNITEMCEIIKDCADAREFEEKRKEETK